MYISKKDPLWVDLIDGLPFWSKYHEIVDAPDNEPRRLKVGSSFVSPPNLEVRGVVGQLLSGAFVYLASALDDARETHVWASYPDGRKHLKLSRGEGVFNAEIGGDTVVVYGSRIDDRPHLAEVFP